MGALATPYFFKQQEQDALLSFCKTTQTSAFGYMDIRQRFQYIDREYIRENTMAIDQHTQSVAANKSGDKRKIADIVIPLVEPQCESALSYLTSVFLTGTPIFGVVSDPNNMAEAIQMEAVVGENSNRGGWARQFMLSFRDGLKYNFHALEVEWKQEKIYSLITDAKMKSGNGQQKEVIWQGNCVKRMDPYNTIFDPRIPLTEQHKKAEFVGYCELHNRVSLQAFLDALPFRMNVTKAFESTPQLVGHNLKSLYYIPDVFTENMSYAKLLGIMNWDLWATGGKSADIQTQFKNLYQVMTRYVRIVPKDFKLNVPAAGQVQIWKIITVNDAVIIYLERLSNAHNYLPIIFGQPIEDGLNLQTKSFAQKQIPLQDIASALANGKLAARRRLVADRGLYDPSRIDEKYINNDSPTAKIPVRPSAYGQELSKAYHQIPFTDNQTATLMQDVREVMGYSDYLSGQNRAQQGQFVKGNKTRAEYEDVQNKSSGRQQTMAINIEHQVMTPIKEIIRLNILQYQPAGVIYSPSEGAPINVNPVELRTKALAFKVSDGLDPSDKIMDTETMGQALQFLQQNQELNMEYSVGGIFQELMAVRGFDLSAYKRSPQQVQQMQQQQVAMEAAKAGGRQQGAQDAKQAQEEAAEQAQGQA